MGRIGPGLVVLLGVGRDDGSNAALRLAEKIAHLRIFADEEGKFNRSAREVGAAALVVSQFTLYADARKGRRPSFIEAAPPEVAEPLVGEFIQALRSWGLSVESGRFGTLMQVELVNDGPVTIVLDTAQL